MDRPDGVTLLTVYVVILFAIPSRLTVGALGGAGSPALVLGAICGLLWALYQVQGPALPDVGAHPVRRGLAFMLAAFATSYVVAMSRPIDPAEAGTADLGLVALASWAGVLLFTHDCVASIERLLVLARRLVAGCAAVAALGVAQFVTGQELVSHITVPGLSENSNFTGITVREGFNRPFGTALHPIEFGAVLTMVLPIALALALSDLNRNAFRRWCPLLLIVVGVTLSVSRSAILGAAVGSLVLAAALPPPAVRRLLAAASAFLTAVFLVVPGMLGTVLGLFTNADEDPSVSSRTDSYALAWLFFTRSPIFGRGFGTFLPRYRIFDNQYLLSLIEVGVVGLISIVCLLGASAMAARRARRLAQTRNVALLGQGLAASACVGAAGLAIFDGFSFPMGTGAMFLLLGMAGSLYRLQREALLERDGTTTGDVGAALPPDRPAAPQRVELSLDPPIDLRC